MENLGIVGVGAITMLCYLIAQGIKATPLNEKWLPVICGVCGAILGVVGMYVMPDFPANDVISSLAIGTVSGLAATGANQVYKQLTKDNGTEDA